MAIDLDGKRVLVFGGAGFIGRYLCRLLTQEGAEIVVADLVRPEHEFGAWIRADIRSLDDVRSAVDGVDLVFNLAAEHRDDITPVSRYFDTNVLGMRNLCQACTELGVSRIVFTSSVAVYGLGTASFIDEGCKPKPFNAYGESKLLAESVLLDWQKNSASNLAQIIRPTVVFGPGNRGNVFNLMRQIHSGRFVQIGSGENRKSIAYVENVAAALMFLSGLKGFEGPYNYADQPAATMSEFCSDVASKLNRSKPKRVPFVFGLLAGWAFDLAALVFRRKFPVSAVRVRKFCAESTYSTSKIESRGFVAPIALSDGVSSTLNLEFGS